MRAAIAEAKLALGHDDVPIGAVVVKDGVIIAHAHNQRESDHNPTAHAEILALERAGAAIGHWNLTGCDLYVTLEPCPMCAGALVLARIRGVVYGAKDEKGGAISTGLNILENEKLNHRVLAEGGVESAECAKLLQDFFQKKRREKNTSGKKA
jgi:tRNA(adenine34) deaminase